MNYIKKIARYCTDPRRLAIATVVALALPNITLAVTEPMTVTARMANIVLPVSVYLLLAVAVRRTGRAVWMLFPLVFLAAFQTVLLYLYGRSVIAVDMFLNLVTTNAGEALELLDNLIPAVAAVVIIYLPLLVAATVAAVRGSRIGETFRRKALRTGYCGAVIGLLLTCACRVADASYRVCDQMYPVNAVYNLCLAIDRSYDTAHHEELAAHFTFGAKATHPADSTETYVLVVGETARAMEFSAYGYTRDTSPWLRSDKGVTCFTHVLSQSNTTHKSVPMLLSAVSADDFDALPRQRGLITAFREAGFYTVFLSNQRRNHSYIDFFGEEADECRFIKDGLPEDSCIYDSALLDGLRRALGGRHRKLLVVLHTYGAHFNYRERYPRSAAQYLPDSPAEARPANRPSLTAAYDNAIAYTDRLLQGITSLLRSHGGMSTMLYTADHGENIYDDRRQLFLHASPIPSYYELHVPFAVWTSDAYRHAYPDAAEALRRNADAQAESSVSVFHTLLHLAGISSLRLQRDKSVASPDYRCGPRHYLNDHNEAVTLRRAGLTATDFTLLEKWGITEE